MWFVCILLILSFVYWSAHIADLARLIFVAVFPVIFPFCIIAYRSDQQRKHLRTAASIVLLVHLALIGSLVYFSILRRARAGFTIRDPDVVFAFVIAELALVFGTPRIVALVRLKFKTGTS